MATLNEQLVELLGERLANRIDEANLLFLSKIGQDLKSIKNLSPTEAQRLIQILKYGGDYNTIVREISKITKMNITDIEDIFSNYAKVDQEFYKQFYQYRGIPFIPFEENLPLKNQTKALANITKNTMENFTRSRALGYTIRDLDGKIRFKGMRETYETILDEALLNVGQGKESFDASMSKSLKQLGESGLKTLDYASGRSIRLDSMVRMHLTSGLTELHDENQRIFGEEFGADGVEISVHQYPAEDHEDVQGRQFTYEEFAKLQETGNGEDLTGKDIDIHPILKDGAEGGYHRPIGEYNCKHFTFSIICGVSSPEYSEERLQKIKEENQKGFELDGKHYTMYEGTQLQRQLELEIRKQKDIQILAKESDNKELIAESQKRITDLTKKYKELSDKSGLKPKAERMKVSNYRRTQVDLKSYYEDNLIGLKNDKYEIKGISNHIIERKWERNLHLKDLQSSFTNPLEISDEITYDNYGRPSIRIIGREVTMYINPKTGTLATWHRTSSKKREKLIKKIVEGE